MPEKKNILVFSNGEVIGDGIVKLPFLAAIKRASPDAHITWFCSGKTVYADVLKDIAMLSIDDFIIAPDKERLKFLDIFFRAQPIKDKYFDIIIDTQTSWKRSLWLKRIPHSDFISTSLGGFLSTKSLAKNVIKESGIFKKLIKLGSAALGKELEFKKIELPDKKYLEQACAILPEGNKYLGLVVGAGQEFKRWPLDNFISVAKLYISKGYKPVVFLGPNEANLVSEIKEKLPEAIMPELNSPYLTIALGQRLSAAIANDSGGGHLIAVSGVQMVSLFRSASVKRKFTPASPKVIAFSPDEFNGNEVKDIPVEAVNGALEELLKEQI